MNTNAIKGGEFIIRDVSTSEVFTPEEWSEEQNMIAQMCDDFIIQEIIPNLDRIDAMEDGLMPSIMEKAGSLGLLGMSVPEDLGGLGVDFKTSLLATEYLGKDFLFLLHMEHIQVLEHLYCIMEMKNKRKNTYQS